MPKLGFSIHPDFNARPRDPLLARDQRNRSSNWFAWVFAIAAALLCSIAAYTTIFDASSNAGQ
jgi:hypothetical protein